VRGISYDLTKPLCDNDILYYYLFAPMFILNTRHSISSLSNSILAPYTFLLLCRRGKFHIVPSCPSAWSVEYPSITNFIVIMLWMTFVRQQSTRLSHLVYIVVSCQRMEYTTYHYENNLWHLHKFLCIILMAGQSNINITPNIYIYVKTWQNRFPPIQRMFSVPSLRDISNLCLGAPDLQAPWFPPDHQPSGWFLLSALLFALGNGIIQKFDRWCSLLLIWW